MIDRQITTDSYVQRYNMLALGRTNDDRDRIHWPSEGWEQLLIADDERERVLDRVAVLSEN